MHIKQWIADKIALRKNYINASMPRKSGVMRTKRQQEVIISLTSHPGRINSLHMTVCSLLHQDVLPDRVVLWLAPEQFPEKKGIPEKLLKLQKYGLEIKWYHDIRSYKKLIPALKEYPNALIITVDDDWYYRKDMVRILLEEHKKYPDQVICHAITKVCFDEKCQLVSDTVTAPGTSSYFNKLLGGSGTLYPCGSLDEQVLDEDLFMKVAPTNDDIWFWGMAVKKGTKIRLAEKASGILLMTDAENQFHTSLAKINSQENSYAKTTNKLLELFPEIVKNLKDEVRGTLSNS